MFISGDQSAGDRYASRATRGHDAMLLNCCQSFHPTPTDRVHVHAGTSSRSPDDAVELSVVLPVFNEAGCIEATIGELALELAALGRRFEILPVDDGSTDNTVERLLRLQRCLPEIRVLRLIRHAGQSAAFGAGFRAARAPVTVLMDADGQNDPADIARLLSALDRADAVCGYRATRRDSWSKRAGSRIANAIRRRILDDGVRDTGCSLKVVRTPLLRGLPMDLAGMHRFIPALLRMHGARVIEIPVHHRPRTTGLSKYSNLGRLAVTVRDLRGVAWMTSRHRSIVAVELHDSSHLHPGASPSGDRHPAAARDSNSAA